MNENKPFTGINNLLKKIFLHKKRAKITLKSFSRNTIFSPLLYAADFNQI